MKMLLVAKGTAGDLYPFVQMGKVLKGRGHEVTFLTHCCFEELVRRAGIGFAPLDTPEESEQRVYHGPVLADPQKLLAATRDEIRISFARECGLIERECDPAGTVLIAHEDMYLITKTVAEKLGHAFVSAFISPVTVSNLQFMAEGYALIAEDINRARAEVNLSPVGDWRAWVSRPHLALGLWPDWFVPADPNSLQQVNPVGFIRNVDIERGEIPPAVTKFLGDGEPPVLISHGTTVPQKPQYFDATVEACRLLNKRALLVTTYESAVPARLPEGVMWLKHLPFGTAMPLTSAVIHHGGIGSTAQALEAGKPHLVLAFGYDRPSNASYLQDLGVAVHLPPVRWRADKIASSLEHLLTSPLVRERCEHLSRRFEGVNPSATACRLIEEFAAGGSWQESGRAASAQEPQVRTAAQKVGANIHELLDKLSPEKRTLLAARLKNKARGQVRKQTIPRREGSGPAPLSFSQQRMWFLDRLTPLNPAFNLAFAVRLTGRLSVGALAQSLSEIVRRHEVMRTVFSETGGEPVQVVLPAGPLTLPVADLRGLPQDEREGQMQRLVSERVHRAFDLARGPLVGAHLIRLGNEEHVLCFVMHHIISDGLSAEVLTRELGVLYEVFAAGAPSPLAELPIQYADFAVWQRGWLQGEKLEAELAYWKRQLGGGLPVFKLPGARPRVGKRTVAGASPWFLLPDATSERLRALSQRLDVTLFMTLLAAFKVLLAVYSEQEDIVVGTPIGNRNRHEVEGLIGFFANSLVLRTDLSGDPTFDELLRRVKEVALGAYAHQDLPFEKLVEVLQPERNLAHTPLFQVAFTLKAATNSSPGLSELRVDPIFFEVEAASFDLVLSAAEADWGLGGVFNYSTDLFDAATIARMSSNYVTLLTAVAAEPGVRLSALKEVVAEANRREAAEKGRELEKLSLQRLKSARRQAVAPAPAS